MKIDSWSGTATTMSAERRVHYVHGDEHGGWLKLGVGSEEEARAVVEFLETRRVDTAWGAFWQARTGVHPNGGNTPSPLEPEDVVTRHADGAVTVSRMAPRAVDAAPPERKRRRRAQSAAAPVATNGKGLFQALDEDEPAVGDVVVADVKEPPIAERHGDWVSPPGAVPSPSTPVGAVRGPSVSGEDLFPPEPDVGRLTSTTANVQSVPREVQPEVTQTPLPAADRAQLAATADDGGPPAPAELLKATRLMAVIDYFQKELKVPFDLDRMTAEAERWRAQVPVLKTFGPGLELRKRIDRVMAMTNPEYQSPYVK
jgi:hypothetical protein